MTLLTKQDILNLKIVRRISHPNVLVTDGFRSTTYDSEVGEIITKSGRCEKQTYVLRPRGIVWLVSSTRFVMPNDVTGMTTLRTTWTRKGILTLTVGIVDPGYNGPLTTAVINFGKSDFCIRKGEPFFRTAFFKHDGSDVVPRVESEAGYLASVEADSTHFSESFLTIDSLAQELVPKIWGIPRWGLWLGVIAFGLALFGLVLPPVTNMGAEILEKNTKIEMLEKRIENLERNDKVTPD